MQPQNPDAPNISINQLLHPENFPTATTLNLTPPPIPPEVIQLPKFNIKPEYLRREPFVPSTTVQATYLDEHKRGPGTLKILPQTNIEVFPPQCSWMERVETKTLILVRSLKLYYSQPRCLKGSFFPTCPQMYSL